MNKLISIILVAALVLTQMTPPLYADHFTVPGGQTSDPDQPPDDDQCPQQNCPKDCKTDPIGLCLGEFFYEHEDLFLPDRKSTRLNSSH